MGMPRTLVLLRHGESEPNVVNEQRKADPAVKPPAGFTDRHDVHMRLSGRGRWQAGVTGEYLGSEHPGGFDKYQVSPLVRTVETAGCLAINGCWVKDDRWRERDWGEFSGLSRAEQAERFPDSTKLRGLHKWYWCPPGGESLATGVVLRLRDVFGTLHREADGQKVIAVTHGEMIDVARFVLERMDPDQWLENDRNPAFKVNNCQAVEYSRLEPGDTSGALAEQLRWMRSICPWDRSGDWWEGEWVEIPRRRRYGDDDLLASVEVYPNLLGPEPATY